MEGHALDRQMRGERMPESVPAEVSEARLLAYFPQSANQPLAIERLATAIDEDVPRVPPSTIERLVQIGVEWDMALPVAFRGLQLFCQVVQ